MRLKRIRVWRDGRAGFQLSYRKNKSLHGEEREVIRRLKRRTYLDRVTMDIRSEHRDGRYFLGNMSPNVRDVVPMFFGLTPDKRVDRLGYLGMTERNETREFSLFIDFNTR